MRPLEKADDKVEKICNALRRETLEPAQEQAKTLLAEAEQQRERILHDAQEQAKQILATARRQSDQERALFQTSLHQAGKQAIELLKQQIEEALFNPALAKLIDKETNNPTAVAQLIKAIVEALQRDGLAADVTALVAKSVSPDEVNRQLGQEILDSLQNNSVAVGDFDGGVKVKLHAKRLTLDISDEALQELLATFLRDHFRPFIFGR